MSWVRLPTILSKVSDIEDTEITGIPAVETEGTIYIRTEEISHLLGEDSMTTMWVKGFEDPYVIELPVGDVISLINQAEDEV